MPEAATKPAVVPDPGPQPKPQPKDDERWEKAWGLPCNVSIEIPALEFTVEKLLRLEPKSIVRTQWTTSANLPLKVNGELIAWCEFEVLGNRLAVRLTELAL